MEHDGSKLAVSKRGRKSTKDNGRLLSLREEEILSVMRTGKKYEDIAKMLCISTETVRTHANNIYKKLGVKNRMEAVNKFYGPKN